MTIEELGTEISKIINQDGDDVTDGEVVDQIVDLLKLNGIYKERK